MRHDKCVQEFVVPRERVTPEVARAFQSVLVSLRNLERKMRELPADSDELPALRREIETLRRMLLRLEQQEVQNPRRHPETQYSSEFGDPIRTMVIDTEDPIETDSDSNVDLDDKTNADGDPRFKLLDSRDILVNGNERISFIELSSDGKLFYCLEGNYFNRLLALTVEIEDDLTDTNTQRPTVRIVVPEEYTGGSFLMIVIFSEAVKEFSASDISIQGATLRNFTGSGKRYNVTVEPTGTGTITAYVPSNVAITSVNQLNINSERVSVRYRPPDTIRPTVGILSPAFYSGSTPFPVSAVFSEDVTEFTVNGFEVTGATVSGFTGEADEYTVTLTPTGTGNITIKVRENAAQDASGNSNEASATQTITTIPSAPRNLQVAEGDGFLELRWDAPARGGPFIGAEVRVGDDWINILASDKTYTFRELTNGTTYTLRVRYANQAGYSAEATITGTPVRADTTRPRISLMVPASHDGSAFNIGITANEPIFSLAVGGVQVVNGTASTLSGFRESYTVTITPNGPGEVRVTVPDNVASDAAGNGNTSVSRSIAYQAPATAPGPPQRYRLKPGDKTLEATWVAPASDGGAPITEYSLSIDNDPWEIVGTRLDKTFFTLTNGQDYTIRLRAKNRVGYSDILSLTDAPEAPMISDPVHKQIILTFDEDLIGDPEAAKKFFATQGFHSTCACVAVGNALTSLGVVSHPLQCVEDATEYVHARTRERLPTMFRDTRNVIYPNNPTILIRGQGLYRSRCTPWPDGRWSIGAINWNIDVYPWGQLRSHLHTTEEGLSYSSWNGVNVLIDHYGVPRHVGFAYDWTWLIRELEVGNKVIAYTDDSENSASGSFIPSVQIATEMSIDGSNNPAARSSSRENHAIWITGIDIRKPNDIRIIINDSNGMAGESYKLADFLASWEDAEFIYTAIGSSKLPNLATITGEELNKEHRELNRIIRGAIHAFDDRNGIQVHPFFDLTNHRDVLQRIGILDRYNTYIRHVAREQKRISDTYGLDPSTFKNIINQLTHE